MRLAQRLLETTSLTVKEVFCQTGFGDESHFVREFKQLYGCTPLEFRAKYNPQRILTTQKALIKNRVKGVDAGLS